MKIVYDVNSLRTGPQIADPDRHSHIVFDVTLAEMCKGLNPGLMLNRNLSSWKGHIDKLIPCKSIGEIYEFEKLSGNPVRYSGLLRRDILSNFHDFVRKIVENANAVTPEQRNHMDKSVLEQFGSGNEVYLKNDHEFYFKSLQNYDLVGKFKKADNQHQFIIDTSSLGTELFLKQYYASRGVKKTKAFRLNNSCTFHFINHCSFIIRSLMWVRDGGFLNMKESKMVNETVDADWCSLAVYGSAVATKDKRNIENIKFLTQCIQRKSKKIKDIVFL